MGLTAPLLAPTALYAIVNLIGANVITVFDVDGDDDTAVAVAAAATAWHSNVFWAPPSVAMNRGHLVLAAAAAAPPVSFQGGASTAWLFPLPMAQNPDVRYLSLHGHSVLVASADGANASLLSWKRHHGLSLIPAADSANGALLSKEAFEENRLSLEGAEIRLVTLNHPPFSVLTKKRTMDAVDKGEEVFKADKADKVDEVERAKSEEEEDFVWTGLSLELLKDFTEPLGIKVNISLPTEGTWGIKVKLINEKPTISTSE